MFLVGKEEVDQGSCLLVKAVAKERAAVVALGALANEM